MALSAEGPRPLDGVDDEQLLRILSIFQEYDAITNAGGSVGGFNIIDDGSPELTPEEQDMALIVLAGLKNLKER